MITIYNNGLELLEDNKDLLMTNPDLACFFHWDGPLLKSVSKKEYAIRIQKEEKSLLAMKVEPFNLLLFGHKDLAADLIDYLVENEYTITNYLCEEQLGKAVILAMEKYGVCFTESLAMDFLEADTISEPSCQEVVEANESNLDEICECMEKFIKDCGLLDQVNREKTLETIHQFYLLFKDGKIASMAKIVKSSETAYKLTDVYTRDEYRGQKLARKVVNTAKNAILNKGYLATLNVDQNNPISYHLYLSLGFKKKFSQGEFRKVDIN